MTLEDAILNVRTLLDEVESDFYTDDEIIQELRNSQNEMLRIVYTNYKNRLMRDPETIVEEVLRNSLNETTVSLNTGQRSVSVPTRYFGYQVVYYRTDNNKPLALAYQREINHHQARLINTVYGSSTDNEPYFEINNNNFVFENSVPGGATGTAKIVYFEYAEDPIETMPEKVHYTIVQGAFGSILRKDADTQGNSNAEYQKFLNMVNEIL